MRQQRDEAYVLGTNELGEADLIVTLLAEHHGRVRGVGASARKSRRRFGGALDPMTRVVASLGRARGRELHRIESLEPVRSFAAMQSDPARQAACAVVSEITAAVVRDEQPEAATFRLLGAVLPALEGGLHPWLAVRYVEYWTLKLHGVLPDLSHCCACGEPLAASAPRFAVVGAGLLCGRCPKPPARRRLPIRRPRRARRDRHPAASRPRPAEGRGPPVRRLGDAPARYASRRFAERTFRSYRHLSAATAASGSRR